MPDKKNITVVIPTCDRRSRLLALLSNLDRSAYPLHEVIIVDSGNDPLSPDECLAFKHLSIQYLRSSPSVCIQRNTGIQKAASPWIFLCDDDIEMPADYLQKLTRHIADHPETGAVSGLFLQLEHNEWIAGYPIRSNGALLWKFIFRLGVWGRITLKNNNLIIRNVLKYYQRKGNHISRSGWPVITDFSGDFFISPIYTLGAALIKKDWLLQSPFDEVLDNHGIGDNYGVALGFPGKGIHILNDAFVYHHQEPANRLLRPTQYFRRVLALDYFISTRKKLAYTSRYWLLWSLTGNLLAFMLARDTTMIRPAARSIWTIASGRNPYKQAGKTGEKVIKPIL
jgi:glycosyltransferase involved in cell wall biosynthesis